MKRLKLLPNILSLVFTIFFVIYGFTKGFGLIELWSYNMYFSVEICNKVHTNEKLRQIIGACYGTGLPVWEMQDNPPLLYAGQGFSLWGTQLELRENTLAVGGRELLDSFPDLDPIKVEETLKEAVRNSPLYGTQDQKDQIIFLLWFLDGNCFSTTSV